MLRDRTSPAGCGVHRADPLGAATGLGYAALSPGRSERMDNFYEQFASAAARFAGQAAVEVQRHDGLEVVRYGELESMAARAAAWLAARGVRPGDRCALLAGNDARWCAAYLGILRLGAVAVPFDTAYHAAQVDTLLADCQARVIFTSPRYAPVALEATAALAQRTGHLCEVLLLAGRHRPLTTFDDVWGETGGEPRWSGEAPPPCPAGPSDPAVVLYTSGTTSDPKGVVLTHGNLLAEREAVFQVLSVDERDAVLGVLPLFHALAQVGNLLLPFAVGARVVFLEQVNTTEMMRALAERDISAFVCVPQFFYLIHQRVMKEVAAAGRLERLAFRTLVTLNGWLRATLRLNLGRVLFARVHAVLGPRMRLLITGGSRFDPAIGRDLHRLGFDILQAYGLTECAGAAAITRPGDRRLATVGPPLPGVEIRILPAARGHDGEVAIRGPIVMAGYHGRPDATAETLADGWLHTGDLGVLDAAGRLSITGRSKEIIVLASGKNIYPEEIEAHYARSPFIRELCVVGRTRAGEPVAERLHAVVVPDLEAMRDRRIVNTREILRFEIEGLSVDLPSHKRIQSYDIRLDPLPRTTTGKLKRFAIEGELDERTREGEARPERPWQAADLVWADDPHVARALAAIAAATPAGSAVGPEANLELDLGLDSMERVELLARLEEVFQTRVPPEVAQGLYTVRELVEALRPAGPAREAGRPARGDVWSPLLAARGASEPALRTLLEPRPPLAAALFAVMKIAAGVARLALRLEVRGREHLPAYGPYILSPNHQSYLDVFLLVSLLPFRAFRDLFFVGASEYFESPFRRRLARLINVVPVDPDSNLLRAMQAGAFGLRHGKVLVLFPEGERSIDGAPKGFKKGAAILSAHLRAPIVPVAIDGLFEVWPRGRRFRWLALVPWVGPRARCRFGAILEPAALPEPSAPPSTFERAYERATERLRTAVVTMWAAARALDRAAAGPALGHPDGEP